MLTLTYTFGQCNRYVSEFSKFTNRKREKSSKPLILYTILTGTKSWKISIIADNYTLCTVELKWTE